MTINPLWVLQLTLSPQFWNVKVVTRRPNSSVLQEADAEPHYTEEERKETPPSLKERQIKMEQEVYRIWT